MKSYWNWLRTIIACSYCIILVLQFEHSYVPISAMQRICKGCEKLMCCPLGKRNTVCVFQDYKKECCDVTRRAGMLTPVRLSITDSKVDEQVAGIVSPAQTSADNSGYTLCNPACATIRHVANASSLVRRRLRRLRFPALPPKCSNRSTLLHFNVFLA